MKKLLIIIFVVLFFGCVTNQNDKTYFDEDIKLIAEKVVSVTPVNSNVLVTDFTDLDGIITHFGRYLAEKTNNYLSNNNEINLVDRNSIELILEVYIPEQSGHLFRRKADTHSVSFRTVIPVESGHSFRGSGMSS